MRRPIELLNENNETIQPQISSLDPEIYNRPWGGIYFLYSMGDNHQLPPVAQKPMYSKDVVKPGTTDLAGKIVLHEYLHTLNSLDVKSTVVLMNSVKRQNDTEYLTFLDNLRNGTVTDKNVDFVYNKCLDTMPQHEKCTFDNAIHLVPQWKFAHPIVHKYLTSLQQPIAKLNAKYCSLRDGNRNHCVKESSLTVQQALCIGGIVMLLKNFIVELNIMNGSIVSIKDIVYETRDGPDKENALPAYIIV